MSGFKSYVGLVASSQKLLAAVTANADQLQIVDPLRGRFDQAVTQLKDLVTRRDTLKADKQTLSRQLLEVAHLVNDLSIDLKAMVKATLGSTAEKLTEFNVKPRRKVLVSDRKSSKAQQPEPTPAPGTPAPSGTQSTG